MSRMTRNREAIFLLLIILIFSLSSMNIKRYKVFQSTGCKLEFENQYFKMMIYDFEHKSYDTLMGTHSVLNQNQRELKVLKTSQAPMSDYLILKKVGSGRIDTLKGQQIANRHLSKEIKFIVFFVNDSVCVFLDESYGFDTLKSYTDFSKAQEY